MGKYSDKNADAVLRNIKNAIAELEAIQGCAVNSNYDRYQRTSWKDNRYAFRMRAVCNELSIFDWWKDTLSISQLKQMKKFVENAIELDFTGYVCFKVGASGCSHGMWAAKEESTDGFSPDCDTLFHSFRSGDNYYDICLNNKWYEGWSENYKIADIKRILEENKIK